MADKDEVTEEFSDDELEGLSPEEIAAIREEEEPADSEEVEGNTDPEAVSAETDEEEPLEAEKAEEKTVEKAEEEVVEAVDETPEEVKPVADRTPVYAVDGDAEKARERMDAIDAERKDLHQKADDGEISMSEYGASLDRLNDEKAELVANLRANALVGELNKTNIETDWATANDRFFAANKDLKDNPVLFGAINANLQRLSAEGELEGLSYAEQIEKAAQEVRSAFGAQKKEDPKPGNKTAEIKQFPQTLGDVPSAGTGDEDLIGGEFSELDKLDGLELEDALARLPEAKVQAWLQRA